MALYRPCVWTHDEHGSHRRRGNATDLVARAQARDRCRGGGSGDDGLRSGAPVRASFESAVPLAPRSPDRSIAAAGGVPPELRSARAAGSATSRPRRAAPPRRHRDRAGRRSSAAGRGRRGRGAPAGRDRGAAGTMIPVPSGSRVWLATGHLEEPCNGGV
jgi:hypothetical protein